MSEKKVKSKKNVPLIDMDPKSLLTHLESANTVASEEEYAKVIEKLRLYHRQECIKTLLEKKRVESVAKEIVQIQSKNAETKKDLDQVKGDYDAKHLKLEKLQKLSQQLSSRMKEMDLKSAEEVKAEKENRYTMSSNFQQSIKDISAKLEELALRRDSIIKENVRLKTVLKLYLEEFDKYKDTIPVPEEKEELAVIEEGDEQEVEEEEQEEEGADISDIDGGAPPNISLEEAVATFVSASEGEDNNAPSQNGDITIVNLNAPPPPPPVEPEVVEVPHPAKTEEEELLEKLTGLHSVEAILRNQSVEYMKTFETFQVKLSGSNTAFQGKQSAIDKLTKEIKTLEKETKQYATKLGSLDASVNSFKGGNEALLKEKEKFTKANDKYQTLITTFQKEIEEMEKSLAV